MASHEPESTTGIATLPDLSAEFVRSQLDSLIVFWRGQRQRMVERGFPTLTEDSYIDAFQTVRMNLLGARLEKE